ncbi:MULTISPECIES: superoxide dismutase family protein [Pantoea]|jgi:Cu-Zn family superoxide dismutase|uniref:Superoxide dismutase [Cu-Zn] n=1 Tax=Pantoea eucrina TaxID=472693 RepID=A0ABS1Z2R0_9GAMM|nr:MULTISPECIES: superoxide dismutase family protein [Pantoea]AIX51034.1 superoxide dismutase [Pantoea sp. PSNIH1]PPS58416.1 superoxide dismutase [Cu-Zn] SodC2 [Pantoea sp. BRM17]MBM0746255.1 superoxide dismutase family protein [Pantoea eucrina]MCL9645916.1 superoxide dismutase family protein [Pantoea eucrina]MDJ0024330.1 superoxide dismutase [Cu-Zn] SodC [Pantoea eucrina]
MKRTLIALITLACSAGASAASQEVTLHQVSTQGVGEAVGKVTITETDYGLQFTPALSGMKPGIHGFHVHAKGSCEPGESQGKTVAAGAAGGHLDPQNSGKHLGPYADGHLGDLPALYVTDDGKASYPVVAPRLKSLSDIKGKALMVHVGGDNHADHPEPLGGGGARLACGVI